MAWGKPGYIIGSFFRGDGSVDEIMGEVTHFSDMLDEFEILGKSQTWENYLKARNKRSFKKKAIMMQSTPHITKNDFGQKLFLKK